MEMRLLRKWAEGLLYTPFWYPPHENPQLSCCARAQSLSPVQCSVVWSLAIRRDDDPVIERPDARLAG